MNLVLLMLAGLRITLARAGDGDLWEGNIGV